MTTQVEDCPCLPGGDIPIHDITGQHEDVDIVISPDEKFDDDIFQAFWNNPAPGLTGEIVVKESVARPNGSGQLDKATLKQIVNDLAQARKAGKPFAIWPLAESEAE